MTDAGWTSTKPTEAGWYWFRDLSRPYEDEREPYVVKVRQYAQHLAVGNCRLEGAPYGCGEWLGPITPDSYQQGRVAGLREAHVFAMEAGAFYTAHRISALIDKAQQAQEEKGVGDGN